MRKLLIIPAVALLASCGETPKPVVVNPNLVKVHGTITNPVSDMVVVSYDEISDTAVVDSSGAFSMEFELDHVTDGFIKHGPEHGFLVLNSGYDINVTLDTKEFDESISFSGNGSGPSTYVAKSYMMEEVSMGKSKDLYSLSTAEFKAKLDELKKSKVDLLASLTNGVDGISSFVLDKANDIKYDWAYKMYTYPANHKMYAGTDAELDSNYYDFLNELDLNNDSLVGNQNFMIMVWAVANQKSKDFVSSDESIAEAKLYAYIKENYTGSIKKELLNRVVGGLLRQEPFSPITAIAVNDYQTVAEDKEKATKMVETLNSWQSLKPGSVAPVFSFENMEGEQVSLADFKGKLVYIDVWATWCGPCKYELPFLKTLTEEFADNDEVAFIQVSVDVDRDKNTWKEMVIEEGILATQLFANGWDESICKAYNINGIPRFMLIDKKGNIVDVNAARPSSGAKALIDSNL